MTQIRTTIARSAWGAVHPDGGGDRPMPFTEWWLHHSVTIAPDLIPPFDDDDAAVRTLERIGQQRFGRGISYTVPITPVGRAYTGHSPHRLGAHTLAHNKVGAAICFVGDYSTRTPTDAQIRRAAEVMVLAHRQGYATRHTLNGGHRDVSATGCPGNAAYAIIPTINALANRLWTDGFGTDKPQPAPTPTPAPRPPAPPPAPVKGLNVKTIDLRNAHRTLVKGPGVKPMQRLLGVTADGLGGAGTRAALGRAQVRAFGRADYIFGPKTAEALLAGK